MSGKSRRKRAAGGKHVIPVGIKVLITYSVILGIFYALFGLLFPVTFLFGRYIEGLSAQFWNITMIALIAVMVTGFYKRKHWSWEMALFLYSFSIVNSFATLFFINNTILASVSDFLKATFFFTLFMNLLTIWYIISRRDYFKKKIYHPHMHLVDKVFISSVYILYFFAIIFVTAMGFEFYKSATFTVDAIVDDMNSMTLQESVHLCETGNFRSPDVCYVTAATVHRYSRDAKDVCERIQSGFYKLTCYQATT